jgi:hypothetical protein
MRSLQLIITLAVVGATSASCTHVAPYERGKLAHPTMSNDVAASPAAEHVYAIHEGAMGGGSVGSSGCGCN